MNAKGIPIADGPLRGAVVNCFGAYVSLSSEAVIFYWPPSLTPPPLDEPFCAALYVLVGGQYRFDSFRVYEPKRE